MFVIGIIVGLMYGWKLALVIIAMTPVLILTGMMFGNALAEATGEGLGAYAEAGGIASEVLAMIRTVTAFGGQEEEALRCEATLKGSLEKAYKSSANAEPSGRMDLLVPTLPAIWNWFQLYRS